MDRLRSDWLLSDDFSALTLEESSDKKRSSNDSAPSASALSSVDSFGGIELCSDPWEVIVTLCGTRSAGVLACTCSQLFHQTFQAFAKHKDSIGDISSIILSKCDPRYLQIFLKTCSEKGMPRETVVDLELRFPWVNSMNS